MRIKDPCKSCLVQPICNCRCDNRALYKKTYEVLLSLTAALVIFVSTYMFTTAVINYIIETVKPSIGFTIVCLSLAPISIARILFMKKVNSIRKNDYIKFIESKMLRAKWRKVYETDINRNV